MSDLPEPDDPFDPEQVPGWSDGDYPPWLQPEMDALLRDIDLTGLAERVDTALNGSYWHVEPGNFERLRRLLELDGFTLIDAGDLIF